MAIGLNAQASIFIENSVKTSWPEDYYAKAVSHAIARDKMLNQLSKKLSKFLFLHIEQKKVNAIKSVLGKVLNLNGTN